MKRWLEKASSIGRKSPDQVQPVYSGAEADRRQWLKIEKILMHKPLHEAAPRWQVEEMMNTLDEGPENS